MRQTSLVVATAAGALIWCAAASAPAQAAPKAAAVEHSAATDISAQRRVRRVTRIEVYPLSRYYRQCVDWYAVENRPSGTVITPQMRCRWALR